MPPHNHARKQIAILIFPGVQALDVAGPMDVFVEANAFLTPESFYEVITIGPSLEPVISSNGMRMIPDRTYDDRAHAELFLVAGGPDLPRVQPDRAMLASILENSKLASRYGSICTGAFALGRCGLLDGMHVTTHWQEAARLGELFPEANVEADRIYIRDGRLITSAGVTAGIDLALAIVEEDHGRQVALAVAKRLVVVARRQGGQSQFSPYLQLSPSVSSPLGKMAGYVMVNLGKRLTVAELADAAGMSARSFARLFVEQTGQTPADFVEQARLDAARNLLEEGDHPLKVIAHRCGFGDPKRMHRAFIRRLGITPQQYRQSFGLLP